MPPSDRSNDARFRLPDDFPDLTLPEKAPAVPVQPTWQVVRTEEVRWKQGDRVLAPWEPQFLYAGTIAEIRGKQALIEFDDGDSGRVLVEQIRPLRLIAGQGVFSRRKMGPFHFPARLVECREDMVLVRFADGGDEEWITVAALRIPCEPRGPGAEPTQLASHLAFLEDLRRGDRVWAPWNAATLFAGTVNEIRDQEVHIHFDDGDRGWVRAEQLVPLTLSVGLVVLARWKMGSAYYPGTITEVDGERVHIYYDDGDKEWTKPAALALPCQPVGPDARPTFNAMRWRSLGGWVLAIGAGILLALLRTSCR